MLKPAWWCFRSFRVTRCFSPLEDWIYAVIYLGFFFCNVPMVKKNFGLVVIAISMISVMPIAIEALRVWRAHLSNQILA